MMLSERLATHWRDLLEIVIIWATIYNAWLFFRGTRGAKVLTGLAVLLLSIALCSEIFELPEISWLFRNLITFLAFALVVIFQPELRRALAALGSHHFFASVTQNRESIEVLSEVTFELANRQLGALIAIERDTNIGSFAETGVTVDCELSPELAVSIFFPKAPLHDGGLIIRNERAISAACVFPISQRVDLDRTLGTRHRAALGLSEESDAVIIVVSEETSIVSICHRGQIERNFNPESFKQRLNQLLLLEKNEDAEKSPSAALGRQDRLTGSGHHPLGGDQKKHPDDRLAF
ncbi:MAG: diadenylate cyclase CdaA [Verrucomicrobiota bacterium]